MVLGYTDVSLISLVTVSIRVHPDGFKDVLLPYAT